MSVVTLTLNDELISARSGETLLEVIRENGIELPTLCHMEGLSERGACRLCLVEMQGNPRLLAAGVRNNEKLRLRPGTTEVWGVDHGSDWYGRPIGDRQGRQPITDFNPPDEFNRYAGGAFYGHPFVTDRRLPRVEYYSRPDIVELAERTVVPIRARA